MFAVWLVRSSRIPRDFFFRAKRNTRQLGSLYARKIGKQAIFRLEKNVIRLVYYENGLELDFQVR